MAQSLCARCSAIPQDIFSGKTNPPDTHPSRYTRYELYPSFKFFARPYRKCQACRTLAKYVYAVPIEDGPVSLVRNHTGRPAVHFGGIFDYLSCQINEFGPEGGVVRTQTWGQAMLLEESPDAERSIKVLRALIDDCAAQHTTEKCGSDLAAVKNGMLRNFYPTRLLQLRNLPTGECCLRVVPGKAAIGYGWVALSHCWGKIAADAPWKLLRSRVQEYSRLITPQALPRTFSDAVEICRKLGEVFLWIDSLCIIQDDYDD